MACEDSPRRWIVASRVYDLVMGEVLQNVESQEDELALQRADGEGMSQSVVPADLDDELKQDLDDDLKKGMTAG